jgi:hypothetical protein
MDPLHKSVDIVLPGWILMLETLVPFLLVHLGPFL